MVRFHSPQVPRKAMPARLGGPAGRQGFAYILLVIPVTIIAVASFLFFGPFHKKTTFLQQEINQVTGPSCPDGPIYTTSPIDPKHLLSVTPLGNLNPPDHTIPTDHIYLVTKANNEIHPELARKVVAPADITISRISHSIAKKSGKIFTDDYSIDFSSCKDIQAKFGHVTKLSEKVADLIKDQPGDCRVDHPRPEDEYTYCRIGIDLALKAGEELGEAGAGLATGLDFWTMDFRSKPLEYANPSRFREEQLHIVCPIDLFEPSLKQILSEKFGRYEQKRTVEPLCGSVNQDIAGTAAGNWITTKDGLIDQPEAWGKSLALVHDNVDPTVGVVVIGGVIAKPQKIQFNPTQSGNTNREFSEVKAKDQIYCYEGGMISQYSNQKGRILIQMTDETSLKVEYQSSGCQDNFQFVNPTTYYR